MGKQHTISSPDTQTTPSGRIYSLLLAFHTTLLCGACAGPAPEPAAAPPPPPPPPAEHVPPPVEEADVPEVTILSDEGFETPESVVYDKKRDVYLVSNVNGAPHAQDKNGFISKIIPGPNGQYEVVSKFIDGSEKGSELNAPKGLAIVADTLYVADIDRVRLFDATTGHYQSEIKLPGSTFVNDIAGGKDGVVYVSDTGLDESFASTGSDAIWVIRDGKAKKLIANKKLGGPNGLIAGDGGVWVVTFGSGEMYWVSDEGKLSERTKISEGKNDGIVHLDDGHLVVSTWASSSVISAKPGGKFQTLVSGVDAPADIGLDCTRGRLLIPLFKKNEVVIHTLNGAGPQKTE